MGTLRRVIRTFGIAVVTLGVLTLSVSATPLQARADSDPERRWAHVVVATGYVDNISICTWAVCGDPASFYRTSHEDRGIMLLDLEAMSLSQQPGPGWWYVDGTFIRDSFERNVTATARILGVELRWSTGGLGTTMGDVTFTVDVAPTGQRFTTSGSSLIIDPLDAGVEHTFTVTAARPDGSTVRGPVVTATPQADPDPDCTDHSVARECRAATDWAVVDPDTMLVENVIVCTPWQCGADGEWRGRMPTDTPWPNFLLIELRGRGGIGWQYVDGTFVDVRPREEPEEFTPPPPAPEPTDDASDASDATTDASAEVDEADEADTEPASTPTTEPADASDAPEPTTEPGPGTDDAAPGDDTTSASSSGPTVAASDDDVATAEEPNEAAEADVETEATQGPIRRVITWVSRTGIVSFLRGLWS